MTRLKVNPDMSGLYKTPINKITLDGDKVSFKVSAGKYPIVFDCKLDGAKLAGVQKHREILRKLRVKKSID